MHHFHYRQGQLHAEEVSVGTIAEAVGTPVYVYSTATLTRHYQLFAKAIGAPKHRVFYAMKANSNQAVIKTLGALGSGADTVSEGEIRRALAAGIPADENTVSVKSVDNRYIDRGSRVAIFSETAVPKPAH